MRNDVHSAALRAATKVAASVVFMLGCSSAADRNSEGSTAQSNLSAGSTAAQELNIGAGDVVKLSFRVEKDQTRVRFAPCLTEIRCSKYRKELCGLEQRVKLIEATLPNQSCRIDDSPTLATCTLNSNTPVAAILDDGSRVSLSTPFGRAQVGQQTALEEDGHGALVPRTRMTLDVDIWGNRADGLDPLVESEKPGIFTETNWQVVTGSLF
jgi:hypothetical protein